MNERVNKQAKTDSCVHNSLPCNAGTVTCYVRTEWDPGSMESKNWSQDKKIAKSKGDHMYVDQSDVVVRRKEPGRDSRGCREPSSPSLADVLMYPFTSLSLQARGARVCKGLPLPARERGRARTSYGPLEGSSYLYHPARYVYM